MANGFKLPLLGCVFGSVLSVGCSSAGNESEPVVNFTPPEFVAPAAITEIENQITTDLPAPEIGQGVGAIEYAAQLYLTEMQGVSELETSATARFYKLTTPLDTAPLLRPMMSLDVCEIGSEASQINAEALDFPIDHLIDSADGSPIQIAPSGAGQNVELSNNAGSYLSLTSTSQVGRYNVESGAEMNTPTPDTLTVNVVGDEFPVFQWQWSKPSVLDAGLREAVRSIATNAELSWNAAPQSDTLHSRIQLYAGYINELTGEYQSFQCELRDDGSFTIPDDVQALYNNGFTANFVDVARYTSSVETIGDISVVNVFVQRR